MRQFRKLRLVLQLFTLDLRSLAMFRIAFGILIISDLMIRAGSLESHYTDSGVLPRAVLFREAAPSISSIHFITGSVLGESFLFLVAAVFAVFLILGYRTRLSTFVSWFMMLSLHGRQPFVLNGGDILFRLLLFWSIWLPLGAKFSLDQVYGVKSRQISFRLRWIAGFGYLFQLGSMYIFSATLKFANPVWKKGMGVYYALDVDQFATPLGYWISRHATLVRALCPLTLFIEFCLPFLLLVPFRFGLVRIVLVSIFCGFHMILNLSLRVGPFQWIAIAAWMAVLPAVFWRKFPVKIEWGIISRGFSVMRNDILLFRIRCWITNLLVIGCTLICLIWNLSTITESRIHMTHFLDKVALKFGFDQKWEMFVRPITSDGWYIIEAKLHDGSDVDLFQNGRALTWEKPQEVSTTFQDDRWRKYIMNFSWTMKDPVRMGFGNYLCMNWNKDHEGDKRLEAFKIIYMKQVMHDDHSKSLATESELWHHECDRNLLKKWNGGFTHPKEAINERAL